MPRRSDIATAVIGSGFIGTVHIEALRRIGEGAGARPRWERVGDFLILARLG